MKNCNIKDGLMLAGLVVMAPVGVVALGYLYAGAMVCALISIPFYKHKKS